MRLYIMAKVQTSEQTINTGRMRASAAGRFCVVSFAVNTYIMVVNAYCARICAMFMFRARIYVRAESKQHKCITVYKYTTYI